MGAGGCARHENWLVIFVGNDDLFGAVNITGTLSGGLALNATTGSWNLANGGTILGGTVTATGAVQLFANGGTLDGVTLGANLTVTNTYLYVKDGLTLNNANVTLNDTGINTFVYFEGTQTLGAAVAR